MIRDRAFPAKAYGRVHDNRMPLIPNKTAVLKFQWRSLAWRALQRGSSTCWREASLEASGSNRQPPA
jgi:hypothetical protein